MTEEEGGGSMSELGIKTMLQTTVLTPPSLPIAPAPDVAI